MTWQKLTSIIEQKNISIRLTFLDGSTTDWSKWLILPSESYGEVSLSGPFRLSDVDYIELNFVELYKSGKLLSLQEIDHSKELEYEMKSAEIKFEKKGNVFFIRASNFQVQP